MRLAVLVICALLAASARADVGIGVSAKSDNATIYIPITVGRFMIEPFVRATDRDDETISAPPSTSRSLSEVQASEIGVGVFRTVPLVDRVNMYFGARLASLDEESMTTSTSGIVVQSQTANAEGESIGAALGFQYSIMERLTIGAEIRLERTETEAEINFVPAAGMTLTASSEGTSYDTRADLVLRFFF